MADEPPLPPPTRGPVAWKLPPINLYEAGSTVELSDADVRLRARTIEETLASFNIEARVVEVNQGPTVTQFGIEPAAGVPVRKILSLQNDIGLRLGAWPVRFEAPVPGKRVVGLEVPNQSVAVVGLRGLLESEEGARVKSRLKLALGAQDAIEALATCSAITVQDGQTLLVDLPANSAAPRIAGLPPAGSAKLFRGPASKTPHERTFLLITPRILVAEEEEVIAASPSK